MKDLFVQIASFEKPISANGCSMSAVIYDSNEVVKGFVVDAQTGRYITDCINVCQGYTAESLAECLKAGGLLSIYRALVNRNAENRLLTSQRNALLRALKKLRNDAYNACADSSCNDAFKIADEVISVVDGGAV